MLERGLARGLGGLAWVAGAAPLSFRRGVGRGLGRLAHGAAGIRRETVERQIAASFPDRDAAWVAHTTRRCYRHFGEEFALLAGGPLRLGPALERVRDAGAFGTAVREAAGTGGGCVIVSAHLGNWELFGALLAWLDLRPLAVARRQRRPWDAVLTSLRAGHDVELVRRDEGAGPLMRGLADGRPVLLVADQHATTGSARLEFLGRPAWTFLGPARLSMAARVPLLFAGLVREGERYGPLLETIATGEAGDAAGGCGESEGAEGGAVAGTVAWLAALERAIRDAPSQYFWFHRRWKDIRPERRPRPRGRKKSTMNEPARAP